MCHDWDSNQNITRKKRIVIHLASRLGKYFFYLLYLYLIIMYIYIYTVIYILAVPDSALLGFDYYLNYYLLIIAVPNSALLNIYI